jgi:hypothetical protein
MAQNTTQQKRCQAKTNTTPHHTTPHHTTQHKAKQINYLHAPDAAAANQANAHRVQWP